MAGGGGSTTSTGTTYTSNLPEYAEPYYRDLMERTVVETQQPYIGYDAQRIAQFTPETEAAYQQVANVASTPLSGVESAAQTAADAAAYQSAYQSGYAPGYTSGYTAGDITSGYTAPTSPTYTAEDITTQRLEGYDLSGYMDPYLENTLAVQEEMAARRFAEQQAGRSAEAVQAGAFGGTRGAVQEALAQRDYNEQQMLAEAQALQAGYANAQEMFMADEARALQAAQLGLSSEELAMQSAAQLEAQRQAQAQLGMEAATQTEAARQAQATLDMQAMQQAEAAAQAEEQARLAASQQQLTGAQQQAGLDQLRQQLQLESSQALADVGAQRQAQEQRTLDQAYEDFINQRDYERQQLAFYSQILQGMPVTPQSEVIQYQPSASPWSQLAGAGLGAYGLYGMMQ